MAVLVTAAACDILFNFNKPLSPAPLDVTLESPNWISVYFSDPGNINGSNYRGGPDEALAESIRNARVSVDIAMHFMNLWSIRDALIETHRRGVPVRIVTESDNLDVDEIIEIIQAGIPVLGDRREGRMHNKFAVIDRQEVWTGSMNMSVNSTPVPAIHVIAFTNISDDSALIDNRSLFTDLLISQPTGKAIPNTSNAARRCREMLSGSKVPVHLRGG